MSEYKLHWAIQTFHRERPYEWKPGANTIAYYKFDGNCNDSSSNWYNLTNNWLTFNTTLSDGTPVAYLDGSSYAIKTWLNLSLTQGTINIWLKKWQNSSSETRWQLASSAWWFRITPTSTTEWNIGHLCYYNGWKWNGSNNTGISNGNWMNVVAVADTTGNRVYVNWQLVTLSYSNWNSSTTMWSVVWDTIVIGRHQSASADWTKWYASNLIFEDKARTAQEVAKYYNRSKWNYQSSNEWWGSTSGAAIQ